MASEAIAAIPGLWQCTTVGDQLRIARDTPTAPRGTAPARRLRSGRVKLGTSADARSSPPAKAIATS